MIIFYCLYFLLTSLRTRRVKFSKSWLDIFLINHSSPLIQYYHSANRSVVHHRHVFFVYSALSWPKSTYCFLCISFDNRDTRSRKPATVMNKSSSSRLFSLKGHNVFTYLYCLVPRNLYLCSVLVVFCLCCQFNVESAYHFNICNQKFAL